MLKMNQDLAVLLESQQEALSAQLEEDWAASLQVSPQEAAPLVGATLAQLIEALNSGAADRLVDPFVKWAREGARQGLKVGALLRLSHSLSRGVWGVVQEAGGPVGWLRDVVDLITLAQVAAVDALMAVHEARQRQTLSQAQARLARQVRELSTPVIKVWEEVLVLPLVGHVDAERATRVMESLLEGIVSHQAEIVIVDVTGVPVVDTNLVVHLMQTVKAASLLGAQSVLVGISAEVALAMINLGMDLSKIETYKDLQSGIEFALERLNLQVVPQGSVDVEYEVEK